MPKVFTVPRGQQSQHIDNAFLGEIPKCIAICMMDNDSYNGNYKKNLFNFKHYNLTQIGISVNGEEVPFKPLKLNFDEKLFVTAYNTLFSGTGKLHRNSGSIIKREDYSEGYTIIVADLTPFEVGDNFDLKKEGTLSIDLVFKSPLAATINVLVYAEYDNVIEIDSNCNVIKEMDISADPVLKTGLGKGVSGQKQAKLSSYRVGFTQTYLIKKNLFQTVSILH